MIHLDKYSSEFENEYWKVVNKKIPTNIQNQIVSSSEKFLPKDFFDGEEPTFYKIVMASFAKMKKAEKYIRSSSKSIMDAQCIDPSSSNTANLNSVYFQLFSAFEHVVNSQKKKASMRVRIVRAADVTVCPYCNRDYINSREDKVAGAQLDHFFSRSVYPIFAVSLYNLVPVCANCNRIKNAKTDEFASPFDETINWDVDVQFKYNPQTLSKFKIDIESKNPAIINNIEKIRIKEAYQIHEVEMLELQEKYRAYEKSQTKEFADVLYNMKISNTEVKQIIFGPKLTMKEMRKKPLGKFMSDMCKELKIY